MMCWIVSQGAHRLQLPCVWAHRRCRKTIHRNNYSDKHNVEKHMKQLEGSDPPGMYPLVI